MTQTSSSSNLYPQATTRLTMAKQDLDQFGYCLLENALSPEATTALRTRLVEQAEAEIQLGLDYQGNDGKHMVWFLLNKGQLFQDLLFHPQLELLISHVLGQTYLLSSYDGHISKPGATEVFHTDQWWMPIPTNTKKETLIRPGSVTRDFRGHHVGGDETMNPTSIAPAVCCNAMWMLDDFTTENGATIVVPGSHLSGRQPDPELDNTANWVPALGSAGTVVILDGRIWHSTGPNHSDNLRIGITTYFCAPQFRQQQNFFLGTSPSVLESASEELLSLLGFKTWNGYGRTESPNREWQLREQYALGELKPTRGPS